MTLRNIYFPFVAADTMNTRWWQGDENKIAEKKNKNSKSELRTKEYHLVRFHPVLLRSEVNRFDVRGCNKKKFDVELTNKSLKTKKD